MRVAPAAAVALLLPAGCLSLGQLSVGAQQAVRDAEDFSELYKDFDADVQALLRGGTGGPGDPLLEDAPADVFEEPSRMQQDSQPQAPSRTASLAQTELDSQPELAAEADAEAQLAADQQLTWPSAGGAGAAAPPAAAPALRLAAEADAEAQLAADQQLSWPPAGAGAAAPPADESPWAPEGDVALPPDEDAATLALEPTALPEVSTKPLAGTSLGEAPPALALEALPMVPGLESLPMVPGLEALPMVPGAPRPPAKAAPAAPALALEALPVVPGLEALPMVPGAPRPPAKEQHTVSPVQLNSNGLAGEITEEAPPDIDDVLARTERIATVLAQDSGRLAQELSLLTRKLKADRAGVQRTLAAEATPPASADDLEVGSTPDRPGGSAGGKEKEKGGGGWLEKSTISSPILTLNHQLADYPTYMFWSGVSLLSIILCCSCCVRPMIRRRQEQAGNARLLQ